MINLVYLSQEIKNIRFCNFKGTGRGGRIGRELVSHVGDREFESTVELNQWLIKCMLVAS